MESTTKSRFERHFSPFTPGILVGLGISIYSMKEMVLASRRKGTYAMGLGTGVANGAFPIPRTYVDSIAFNKFQRMRMFSSFGRFHSASQVSSCIYSHLYL